MQKNRFIILGDLHYEQKTAPLSIRFERRESESRVMATAIEDSSNHFGWAHSSNIQRATNRMNKLGSIDLGGMALVEGVRE